jgi:glycerol-3-phosphate dehydrogenase
MQHEDTAVVVVGLSTGAAIVPELARRRVKVIGLDRADGLASTLNNQKWKHGGLLYTWRELAQKLWDAYVHMHPLERRHLRNIGGHFLVRTQEELDAYEALWRDWGIPFGRLAPNVLRPHGTVGSPAYAGGFLTFDSVIDFPALLPALHAQATRLGARLLTSATVTRLVRDGETVTGVVYAKDGHETLLHCKHCIVAIGGWAPEMLRAIGVQIPVQRWKSHILTVDTELVPRITVWLDAAGVTLVPYAGQTLIADKRRYPAADGNDRTLVPDAVEGLIADLADCFPRLRQRRLAIRPHT